MPGILQRLALGGNVQKVGVDGEGRFAPLVLGDGNLVALGELQQLGARIQLPLAPGRDHLDVRIEGVIGELEAHLVIALAGGAVGHRIGAGRARDLDLALGDQRPGDGCTQKIAALVKGVGPEHGEDEVAHEFLAQILDMDFLDPHHLGLLARRPQFLALSQP